MYGLRKLSVVACLAVVAATVQAYDWNQPVTISSKGQTLKQFFADLRESQGVPIDVSPICANEIISIRVKNRPMSEVIAKIADATGLGFLGSGEGYLVVRSDGNTPALAQRHKDVSARKIKSSLDANSYVQNAGEKIDSIAVLQAFLADPRARRNSPVFADQALPILLDEEEPSTWASVPLNERWVFALSPNARQKFMPNRMKRIALDLVNDYRKTLFELQKLPENLRPAVFGNLRNDLALAVAINAGNPEVIVSVYRAVDYVEFNMHVMGANLQSMSSASLTLQMGGLGSSQHTFTQPFIKFDEFGTAAKQMAAAFVQGHFAGQRSSWGNDAANKARTNDPAMLPFVAGIDPAARNILLGQTKLDPVGSLADYVFANQMTTENYVIAFPDSMASELAWDASRDNLNSTAKTWNEITFAKEGEWSVLGLADPISAWSTRVPRGQLYSLASKVSRQHGLVSLTEKIAYARASGRGIGDYNWDVGALTWLFGTAAGLEVQEAHGRDYFPLLIYGALNVEQRQAASRGDGLPWNQISGIYPLLTDWYYNGRSEPAVSQRVSAAPSGEFQLALNVERVQQQVRMEMVDPSVLGQISIQTFANGERTELLPVGLGSATTLRLSVQTQDGFIALNSLSGESKIFDPRAYARNKASAAYDPRGAGVNDPAFYKQYLNTSNIMISATLKPYDQLILTDRADGVEGQGGFGSYESLKGSIRSQIDLFYSQFEREYLNNRGREVPPPDQGGIRRVGGGIPPLRQ